MILDLGLEPFLTVRVHDWFSGELDKSSSFRDPGLSHMLAGIQGFEPQLTVPETVVLPLDDIPMCRFILAGRDSLCEYRPSGTILPEIPEVSSYLSTYHEHSSSSDSLSKYTVVMKVFGIVSIR